MGIDIKSLLANQYVLGFLIIVLLLYGSLAQQPLPPFMYRLFESRWFTFLVLGSLALIATQDWCVAFIVALIFAVILHQLNQMKIKETFEHENILSSV